MNKGWEGWGKGVLFLKPHPPPPPPPQPSLDWYFIWGNSTKSAVYKSRFVFFWTHRVPEKNPAGLRARLRPPSLYLTVYGLDELVIIMTTSENLEESGSSIIHPCAEAQKKFGLHVPIALQCVLIIGVWTALFLPIAFYHLPVSEVRAWVYLIYFLSLVFTNCLSVRLDRFYDSV